jgi:predicted AlkP superfamily phosphohydrolase/phosphomutase
MVDAFLGQLAAGLDENTSLVVMSDHGFGSKHPATAQINQWLASEGFLARTTDRARPGGLLAKAYKAAVGGTSRRVKERLWQTFPKLRDAVQSRLCFSGIDWSRTRAYSDSLFANVRVNLRGRERDGTVAPGAEYERLVAALTARLRGLRDRRSGEPIVEQVFRREDTYHGPHVDKAPDLLIRWREDIAVTGIRMGAADAGGPATPAIPGEDPFVISGDHRLHGILLARGPGLARGQEIDGARIVDLAPTILYGMGLPVPRGMDGTVLRQAFAPGFARQHPCTYEDPAAGARRARGGGRYTPDEETAIRDRLRSLGYVE